MQSNSFSKRVNLSRLVPPAVKRVNLAHLCLPPARAVSYPPPCPTCGSIQTFWFWELPAPRPVLVCFACMPDAAA